MLSKRLIKSNDAAGGVCLSDETDIFGDGSGVALYQLNWDGSDKGGQYDGVATDVSFVNGKIDSAGSFNGSSSVITSSSIGAAINVSDLSFSLWLNTNNTSNAHKVFLSQYDESGNNRFYFSLKDSGISIIVYSSSGSYVQNFPSIISTNQWYHVAVIQTSTATKLYLNGSLQTSSSGSGSPLGINIASSPPPLYFGQLQLYVGTFPFNGDLDQVRIFNKALSASEVTTLYNEVACEKTCTTDDNQLVSDCIAYYKLDGNADDALNTYDGTPTNVSWTQGRFGSAGGFNGSSSQIDIPATATTPVDFSNRNYSISAWVKSTHTLAGIIYSKYGDTPTTRSFSFLLNGSGNVFMYETGSAGDNSTVSSAVVNDGNWHHVVATKSPTATIVYVDGVLDTQNLNTFTSYNAGTETIHIGRDDVSPDWFNGSIDQVRIYDRAITATEVETLYNEVACPSGASFNTVIYSGNNNANTSIGGVGFQPDLVWVKDRDTTGEWHVLTDSVRGISSQLFPNDVRAQDTKTTMVTSFNNDGFSVGSDNAVNGVSSRDYVAWCWKAGGDAVTNTDGTITSEVSANVDAGFSIVSYTGSATQTGTVGHGLNSVPEMIMVKNRDGAYSWVVYTTTTGASDYLVLNETYGISGSDSRMWNDTLPTSSVFTASNGNFVPVNENGSNFIAYCFHSVAGFSKFGSYTGGSTGSGNVINTGFKPLFLMVKRTDIAGDAWQMFDSVRGGGDTFDNYVQANEAAAETSYSLREVNFANNGFYWTNAESGTNISGGTYIYMAFANQF